MDPKGDVDSSESEHDAPAPRPKGKGKGVKGLDVKSSKKAIGNEAPR